MRARPKQVDWRQAGITSDWMRRSTSLSWKSICPDAAQLHLKKRRTDEDESDEELFRLAPSLGAAGREPRKGETWRKGLLELARYVGERDGAASAAGSKPKMISYLNSVFLGGEPPNEDRSEESQRARILLG